MIFHREIEGRPQIQFFEYFKYIIMYVFELFL